MKGFIKTLEAIIASLIILASLTYFFSTPNRVSGWSNALLQTEVEDSLATLYKSGVLETLVKDNNTIELNSRLKQMVPDIVDFSIEIRGIPNPEIRIAVLGDSSDATNLKSILSESVMYKYRMINFYVKNVMSKLLTIY